MERLFGILRIGFLALSGVGFSRGTFLGGGKSRLWPLEEDGGEEERLPGFPCEAFLEVSGFSFVARFLGGPSRLWL